MSNEAPWGPIGNGPRMQVILLNVKGEVRHTWEATVERKDDGIVILKAAARKQLHFEQITIDPGDIVVQYFPRHEWFHIQEYLTPSGKVKGWYCNIATPPKLDGSSITVQDMILDMFVSVDGHYQLLDEDELESKGSLLDARTKTQIEKARNKLIQMIENQVFPFHFPS